MCSSSFVTGSIIDWYVEEKKENKTKKNVMPRDGCSRPSRPARLASELLELWLSIIKLGRGKVRSVGAQGFRRSSNAHYAHGLDF